MIEKLNCHLHGGLLLMEPEKLQSLMKMDFIEEEWDFLSALSMAVDVAGETDQGVEDDEGGLIPWPDAWRDACEPLVDLVNRGQMALLILNGGQYIVDTDLDAPRPTRAGLVEYQSRLEITGGTLLIGETGPCTGLIPRLHVPDPSTLYRREIPAPVGSYHVHIFLFPTAEVTPWGRYSRTFGTEADPALYVRWSRSDAPVPPIDELFHHEM